MSAYWCQNFVDAVKALTGQNDNVGFLEPCMNYEPRLGMTDLRSESTRTAGSAMPAL